MVSQSHITNIFIIFRFTDNYSNDCVCQHPTSLRSPRIWMKQRNKLPLRNATFIKSQHTNGHKDCWMWPLIIYLTQYCFWTWIWMFLGLEFISPLWLLWPYLLTTFYYDQFMSSMKPPEGIQVWDSWYKIQWLSKIDCFINSGSTPSVPVALRK